MRIDERHQRQEAVVGDAEDANLTVCFRDVLYQPVDRVISVGCMIDSGGVLRSTKRTIHHVVAFGAILSANVLDDAYVATFDDYICCVVVPIQDWP